MNVKVSVGSGTVVVSHSHGRGQTSNNALLSRWPFDYFTTFTDPLKKDWEAKAKYFGKLKTHMSLFGLIQSENPTPIDLMNALSHRQIWFGPRLLQ